MASEPVEVATGMTVCGTDGERIGTVTEIYVRSPGLSMTVAIPHPQFVRSARARVRGDAAGPGAKTSALADDLTVEQVPPGQMPDGHHVTAADREPDRSPGGMEAGRRAFAPGNEDYFKVDRGGILGIGAKELYVPYTDIETVTSDGTIKLGCPRNKCDERYTEKPPFLRDDEVPEMPLV